MFHTLNDLVPVQVFNTCHLTYMNIANIYYDTVIWIICHFKSIIGDKNIKLNSIKLNKINYATAQIDSVGYTKNPANGPIKLQYLS